MGKTFTWVYDTDMKQTRLVDLEGIDSVIYITYLCFINYLVCSHPSDAEWNGNRWQNLLDTIWLVGHNETSWGL